MVNIVVATHGGFAQGIMSTLDMIAGASDAVTAFGLMEGDDPGAFEEKLSSAIDELNAQPGSEGTLLLVDLLGGTPSNCAVRIMREKGPDSVRCLTGLSFPMLVEAVFNRESKSLEELEGACREAAAKGVVSLAELFEKAATQ